MIAAMMEADRLRRPSCPDAEELTRLFPCLVDCVGPLWSETQTGSWSDGGALTFADRAVAAFEATPFERRNLSSQPMTQLLQVKALTSRRLGLSVLHCSGVSWVIS